MKILSWNVNGVRSLITKLEEDPLFQNKSGLKGPQKHGLALENFFKHNNADIICFQETKCTSKRQLITEDYESLIHINGYESFWAFGQTSGANGQASRSGYSGTTTWVRKGLTVDASVAPFNDEELDKEGRVVMTDHTKFVLLNCYFPNSAQGERIEYKMKFVNALENLILKLQSEKREVIVLGDFNIVHNTVDSYLRIQQQEERKREAEQAKLLQEKLASQGITDTQTNKPEVVKARMTKGMSDTIIWEEARKKEKKWFQEFLVKVNFLDTFRHLYPTTVKYSWWDVKTDLRRTNQGVRIDYICTSKSFESDFVDATVETKQLGSDHCPITFSFKIDLELISNKAIHALSSEFQRKTQQGLGSYFKPKPINSQSPPSSLTNSNNDNNNNNNININNNHKSKASTPSFFSTKSSEISTPIITTNINDEKPVITPLIISTETTSLKISEIEVCAIANNNNINNDNNNINNDNINNDNMTLLDNQIIIDEIEPIIIEETHIEMKTSTNNNINEPKKKIEKNTKIKPVKNNSKNNGNKNNKNNNTNNNQSNSVQSFLKRPRAVLEEEKGEKTGLKVIEKKEINNEETINIEDNDNNEELGKIIMPESKVKRMDLSKFAYTKK